MSNASKVRAECDSTDGKARTGVPDTYVGGFLMRDILVGFDKLGLETERLCAAAGQPTVQLMDNTARVPNTAFWRVWREAMRQSGDPSLGLRVSQAIPLRSAGGLVTNLAAVSETGIDAIRCIARYSKLFSDRLEIDLHEDESTMSVEFRIVNVDDPLMGPVYESFMVGFWRFLDATLMADVTPLHASFRHAPPPDTDAYMQFFGCPVEFDASSYGLRLRMESIRGPMVAAQPRAERQLRALLDSELRTLAPEFSVAVAEQVRAVLEEHERPTQASIACRLGVGRRTLQRRLHDEGTSFRRIAEREQCDLAIALLSQPGHRVIDVALSAGFDDATSFSKAFRRWIGESPTAYRARVLAGAA